LELLAAQGTDYVALGCPSLITPQALLRYVTLGRLVDSFRPDIVHTYGFGCDVLGAAVRVRYPGIRLITSRRGEDGNRRHQQMRRLANRCSDKVVCVSSEVAKFVEATERPPAHLLQVIPNGVSIEPRVNPQNRSNRRVVRFGTLGTVKPVKGTDLLVEAFMKFDPCAQVELCVAGVVNRPWAAALRDRASGDDRIRFIGRTKDPQPFLSSLDVFVLPSRSEGMSNALLEAMAMGVASVATDVGSNRSVLNPVQAPPGGVICQPTNDSLFEAMNHLSQDLDKRLQYGQNAIRIVNQTYSTDVMVAGYVGLYRLLARTLPAGGRAGIARTL
jgi:glycosyltransferase involved in cell wall biosynthesis